MRRPGRDFTESGSGLYCRDTPGMSTRTFCQRREWAPRQRYRTSCCGVASRKWLLRDNVIVLVVGSQGSRHVGRGRRETSQNTARNERISRQDTAAQLENLLPREGWSCPVGTVTPTYLFRITHSKSVICITPIIQFHFSCKDNNTSKRWQHTFVSTHDVHRVVLSR